MVISPTFVLSRSISSSRASRSRSRSLSALSAPARRDHATPKAGAPAGSARETALPGSRPAAGVAPPQVSSLPRTASPARPRPRRRQREERATAKPRPPARPGSNRSCCPCSTLVPSKSSAPNCLKKPCPSPHDLQGLAPEKPQHCVALASRRPPMLPARSRGRSDPRGLRGRGSFAPDPIHLNTSGRLHISRLRCLSEPWGGGLATRSAML